MRKLLLVLLVVLLMVPLGLACDSELASGPTIGNITVTEGPSIPVSTPWPEFTPAEGNFTIPVSTPPGPTVTEGPTILVPTPFPTVTTSTIELPTCVVTFGGNAFFISPCLPDQVTITGIGPPIDVYGNVTTFTIKVGQPIEVEDGDTAYTITAVKPSPIEVQCDWAALTANLECGECVECGNIGVCTLCSEP